MVDISARGTTVTVSSVVKDVDLFATSVKGIVTANPFILEGMDADVVSFDAFQEDTFKRRLLDFEGTSSASILKACLKFPGEAYLAGGSVSIALDATLNPCDKLFERSDLNVFVMGCRRRQYAIVSEMLALLTTAFGAECFVITPVASAESELRFPFSSVINVWVRGKARCLQFVLVSERFRTIGHVLHGFDFPHLQCAFDTESITMTHGAVSAMAARVTSFAPGFDRVRDSSALMRRVYKAVIRDYEVRDSPFSFSSIMRAWQADVKWPAFVYQGDVDALVVHLGISRREVFVSFIEFFDAWGASA
jgi:hypothetical protein